MKRFALKRLVGWSAVVVMALAAGGCGPRQPAAFSFIVAADMRDYTPPEHAGPQ